MGCKNSTLIKRREFRSKKMPPDPIIECKVSKNDILETGVCLPVTLIEPSTSAGGDGEKENHLANNSQTDQPSSDAQEETTDSKSFDRDDKESNRSQTRFDRRRISKAANSSAISTKIFKCKRAVAKSKSENVGQSSASSMGKSNTEMDFRSTVRLAERKLSTPIMSTPSIVIDEVPPVSAPPNGTSSTMWDILTAKRAEDDGHCQPGNGLVKHRFSFGRQRSNDKMMAIQEVDSISDDWVLKIIRCFPFPSPKQSPKNSPPTTPTSTKALPLPGNFPDCPFLIPTPSVAGPTPNTTKSNFRLIRQKLSDPTNECKYSALGLMVRRTIETTFPPLIPWDVWLRKRLASWTQCSGHEGTVVPATEKTVWKKCARDSNEAKAYKKLMDDTASAIAPKFYKEVDHKGECFLELEDLSRNFTNPCIMDVKMGTRTFLECEVRNESKRGDLYEKMVAIDPDEPSQSEREEKAITKLRYMTFREQKSSTTSLGFRIDAAKMAGGVLQKDFQKIKTREQIAEVFTTFLGPNCDVLRKSLLARLRMMREKIERSEFFRHHEVIGSSILIIHDSNSVDAWAIDFAKALPAEEGELDHRTPWKLGNREDGYLFGLDNLIEIIETVQLNKGPSRDVSVCSKDRMAETGCQKSTRLYSTPISLP